MWKYVCAFGFAILVAPVESSSQSADESAVRAVAGGFSAALAAGDSAKALSLMHPDVVIFEGGRWESLSEYRSGHLRADIAYLRAVRQESLRDVVTISGDLALLTRESRTSGTYRERPIDSVGAETMVLLRTPGGWKIRHIHWSSRARNP